MIPLIAAAVGSFLPLIIEAFTGNSPERAAAIVKPKYDAIVQRLIGSGMSRAEAELTADQHIGPELEKAERGNGLGILSPLLSIAGGVGGFAIGKKLAVLAGKAAAKKLAETGAKAVAKEATKEAVKEAPKATVAATKVSDELPDIGRVVRPGTPVGAESRVAPPLTQQRPVTEGSRFEGDVPPSVGASLYPEMSLLPESRMSRIADVADDVIIPEVLSAEEAAMVMAPRGQRSPPAYMTTERVGMPFDEASPMGRGFTLLPRERLLGYDQAAYVDRSNELDALRRQFRYIANQGG